MKAALILGSVVALLALGPVRSDEKKQTSSALKGTYTIVSGEKFGKALPEERIKGHKVSITEDRIVATDKDNKETYVASYKLDRNQSPWVITMTSLTRNKGETANGLIEQTSAGLRLIYSLQAGDRPTEFKTRDRQLMIVMKRSSK